MIGFVEKLWHGRMQILLSAYIDGEVTPSEAVRVEEHLAGCEECVSELESLRATSNLLRSLPDLEVPLSFALREAPAPVGFTPQLVWTTRFATSLAALFLVALLLVDVLGFVDQTPKSGPQEQEFRTVLAPAPAAPASEPAPAAAAVAAPAPSAAAPAPPAAPAPAPALASTSEPEVAPAAPAAPALAAAAEESAPTFELAATSAETVVETDDTTAPQTLAAPVSPEVEEPPLAAKAAAAPEQSTQTVASQPGTDEPAQQAVAAESLAAPAPSVARSLPAPAVEEKTAPVEEPAAEAIAGRDGVSDEGVTNWPAVPVRELEIALGVLLALLLAVTYWVTRRRVGSL